MADDIREAPLFTAKTPSKSPPRIRRPRISSMASEKKPVLGHVLVVGGCGLVGSNMVRMLLRDYTCQVSVVDLRCTGNRLPDSAGVAYYEADIANVENVKEVFEQVRPAVVIHTASPAAQGADKVAHTLFKKVNIDGTQAIVDASRATSVKALVYTSSASVISDSVSDLVNADERWPAIRGKEQTDYYAETKAAAEEIVLKANNNVSGPNKFLTCSIRPSAIFGEGDAQVIPGLMRALRNGNTGVQIGENNNLFDFTYAENVVHGHLLAAQALLAAYGSDTISPDAERVDGEAFFITNDSPVYFWDFARAVWTAAGSTKGIKGVRILPRSVGMVLGYLSETYFSIINQAPTLNRQRIIYSSMTRYYSITKAKRRLGYEPLVPMDEAVRRSVKFFLEHEKA